MGAQTESQRRISALGRALGKMKASTAEASRCCDQLTKRARHLDSLTSPASDASSMLSKASNNLASTLVLMKDAREKFDTVRDCEPAIERLHRGVLDVQAEKSGSRKPRNPFQDDKGKIVLSEQDIYAAADSMEIIRDAFDFFIERKHWRSTATALASLECVHQMGVSSMCVLASIHLVDAGQAVRIKRVVKQESETHVTPSNETAEQTRERLSQALQNRDLLRSIGEFEEYQPVEARVVRELRGIFECLSGNGFQLHAAPKTESTGMQHIFGLPANRVVRTEKVGSGGFTNLVQRPLKTGFPHVDAYGEARKTTAFSSIDAYHRRIKAERKRNAERFRQDLIDNADMAARDAVRCLEHAMIVVAGEKNVYRTVVSPSLTKIADEDAVNDEISPFYRKACAAAYSHVVACVVDKTMDIIETMFLKEGGIGHASGSKSDAQALSVRSAASAAAGGLRILDGVRMLGPSLAKLCDMPVGDGTPEQPSLASTLCIAIHRTTVKNCARTLENLAKAIQEDPLKKTAQRAKDARVAPLTVDVVRAVRLVSPFVSAYKSVSKRRQLPWDPNMGDNAGELESFIRFLVMRLLNSLKGKALSYTKHAGELGQAKSNMFMMNNAVYLRNELGPSTAPVLDPSNDYHRIESSWFIEKVNKLFESEKNKYLSHWEVLNTHLTSVEHDELEYQKKNDTILSLDSGRLIKNRFSGFNEDFERLWEEHRDLCVVDTRLRDILRNDVAGVFLPLYSKFYDKYSQIRFSKKHQDEYTKFSPYRIEEMLDELYVDAE